MTYEHLQKWDALVVLLVTIHLRTLNPLLKRLHGGHTEHCGKIPERMEGNIHLKKELDELKLILKQYVQE